jgi:2-methylcitrate synthase/citrate synthase II
MVGRSDSFRLFVHGIQRLVERIDMSDEPYYPGLEGVIAGETAICTIAGGLSYRGYSIEELARDARFIEVAYLLLEGELPNQEQLADFQSILVESGELPPSVTDLIASIPLHVSAMDVLRTGISAISHFDPQLDDNSREANVAKTLRLLAQIPQLIAARYRLSQGETPLKPNDELSFSANLLYMLTGKEPPASHERATEVSLILYAEHEFNASTFTARVVTSTMSDLYSSIAAAVGALKGPLHGGANERVMEVLEEVGTAGRAESWVRDALANKERIMGFGHRVYKTGDPRAVILKQYCAELAEETGQTELEEIANTIENIVVAEKGLPPNLDWPSARLYHYMGLEVELYTPLFVVSRVLGWAAHVIEQTENNRLIRPRSKYKGPKRREFTPLVERG